MDTVLHVLDRLKPGRPGRPQGAAAQAGRALRPAAASSSVISDFYEEPEAVLDAITPLRFRGNDLIVFHVLDPRSSSSASRRAAVRGSRERRADAGRAGRRSARNTGRWCRRTSTRCSSVLRRARRLLLLDTSQPLDHALYPVPERAPKMMKSGR
jgi:hypothetical protein